MLVENLIKRLQELRNELGNVEVSIIIEDCDGTETTGFQDINEIDISMDIDGNNKEIYIGYFCENDKNLKEEK